MYGEGSGWILCTGENMKIEINLMRIRLTMYTFISRAHCHIKRPIKMQALFSNRKQNHRPHQHHRNRMPDTIQNPRTPQSTLLNTNLISKAGTFIVHPPNAPIIENKRIDERTESHQCNAFRRSVRRKDGHLLISTVNLN